MRQTRYWLISLGIATALLNVPHAKAEEPSSSTVPEKIISPRLEKTEQPNKTYRLGETISYRVLINWSAQVEDLRLSPLDLNLENLELLGVNQETVSEPEKTGEIEGFKQILTFRFTPQKPGRAAINHFLLRWTQASDSITSELVIPSVELTIIPPPFPWIRIIIFLTSVLGVLALPISILMVVKKKKSSLQTSPPQSLEESTLERLRTSHFQWETKAVHQEFLGELIRLLEQYFSQKLDWNPSQESYNALQKKAQAKWSKKDGEELGKLLQNIEYERFSGMQPEREKLAALYQAIYSFIERRKIV